MVKKWRNVSSKTKINCHKHLLLQLKALLIDKYFLTNIKVYSIQYIFFLYFSTLNFFEDILFRSLIL